MIKFLLWTILTVALTGCLLTRSQVEQAEQKKVVQEQVVHLQKTNADQQTRFSDLEADVRNMSGRIEVLENKLNINSGDKEKSQMLLEQQLAETNKKVLLLQEEILKLEEQIAVIGEKSGVAATESKKNTSQQIYKLGEESFNKKDWKKSVVHFQKYRDTYPKGKRFPEATYMIGLSFLELGLRDEAKSFFEEVVTKYPTSSVAKAAKARLKKK